MVYTRTSALTPRLLNLHLTRVRTILSWVIKKWTFTSNLHHQRRRPRAMNYHSSLGRNAKRSRIPMSIRRKHRKHSSLPQSRQLTAKTLLSQPLKVMISSVEHSSPHRMRTGSNSEHRLLTLNYSKTVQPTEQNLCCVSNAKQGTNASRRS